MAASAPRPRTLRPRDLHGSILSVDKDEHFFARRFEPRDRLAARDPIPVGGRHGWVVCDISLDAVSKELLSLDTRERSSRQFRFMSLKLPAQFADRSIDGRPPVSGFSPGKMGIVRGVKSNFRYMSMILLVKDDIRLDQSVEIL
jgi:hypothetical protein